MKRYRVFTSRPSLLFSSSLLCFHLLSSESLSTNRANPSFSEPKAIRIGWSYFIQPLLPSHFCLSPRRSPPETVVAINSAMAFALIEIDAWAPIAAYHTLNLSAPTIPTASNAVTSRSVLAREPTLFAHGRTSAPFSGREGFFQVRFFGFGFSPALEAIFSLIGLLSLVIFILIWWYHLRPRLPWRKQLRLLSDMIGPSLLNITGGAYKICYSTDVVWRWFGLGTSNSCIIANIS